MTTNDNEGKPGYGAHDQRPQVTLDLKATELSSDPMPEAADTTASEHVAAEAPSEAAAQPVPPPYIESKAGDTTVSTDEPPRKRVFSAKALNEANIQSFATHLAAGLLGSLVALIGAYYGAGAFRERLPLLTERNAHDFRTHIASYDSRIAAYEARLTKQDERIAAMDKAAASQRQDIAQAQARVHSLAEQAEMMKLTVAMLTKRVDERPATTADTATTATPGVSPDAMHQSVDPLKAKVAELEARIAQMTASQSSTQTDARASAVSVALYNLRRAVNEGKPYAAELQSVASLTPVPLELDALNAARDKGVRSLQQLQTALEPAINQAIEAENKAGDNTIADGVWSRMKSVVRVRRVGDVAGDDTQSVLARAEVRVTAGDVPGAVAEASKLKGEAAKVFKPWLDDAQAKLAADNAITKVETALLAALGDKAKKGS